MPELVRVFDNDLFKADDDVGEFSFPDYGDVMDILRGYSMCPVEPLGNKLGMYQVEGLWLHIDWTRLVPESEVRRDG